MSGSHAEGTYAVASVRETPLEGYRISFTGFFDGDECVPNELFLPLKETGGRGACVVHDRIEAGSHAGCPEAPSPSGDVGATCQTLEDYKSLAKALGARVDASITRKTNLLVARRGLTIKRILAEERGIVVVLPQWLELRAELPPSTCTVPWLYGYEFSASCMPVEERNALSTIIRQHGGHLNPSLTMRCDMLLIPQECARQLHSMKCRQSGRLRRSASRIGADESAPCITEKIRFAWRHGIPVVEYSRFLLMAGLSSGEPGPRLTEEPRSVVSVDGTRVSQRRDLDTISDVCGIQPVDGAQPTKLLEDAMSELPAGSEKDVPLRIEEDNMEGGSSASSLYAVDEEVTMTADALTVDETTAFVTEQQSLHSATADYYSCPVVLPEEKKRADALHMVSNHYEPDQLAAVNCPSSTAIARGFISPGDNATAIGEKGIPSLQCIYPLPLTALNPPFLSVVLLGCTETELVEGANMCLACRFLRLPVPTPRTDVVILGSLYLRKRRYYRIACERGKSGARTTSMPGSTSLRGLSTHADGKASSMASKSVSIFYDCPAELVRTLEVVSGVPLSRLVPFSWLAACYAQAQGVAATGDNGYHSGTNSVQHGSFMWKDSVGQETAQEPFSVPEEEVDEARRSSGQVSRFYPLPLIPVEELPRPGGNNFRIRAKAVNYESTLQGTERKHTVSSCLDKNAKQDYTCGVDEPPRRCHQSTIQEVHNNTLRGYQSRGGVPAPEGTVVKTGSVLYKPPTSAVLPGTPAPCDSGTSRAVANTFVDGDHQEAADRKRASKMLDGLLCVIFSSTEASRDAAVTSLLSRCLFCFVEGDFSRVDLAVVRGLIKCGGGSRMKENSEGWSQILSRKRGSEKTSPTRDAGVTAVRASAAFGRRQRRVRQFTSQSSKDRQTASSHLSGKAHDRENGGTLDGVSTIPESSTSLITMPALYMVPHYFQRPVEATGQSKDTNGAPPSTLRHQNFKSPLKYLQTITSDYILFCLACQRLVDPRSCFLFCHPICSAPDMTLLQHHRTASGSHGKPSHDSPQPALSPWVWERRYEKMSSVGVCISFVWQLPLSWIERNVGLAPGVHGEAEEFVPNQRAAALLRVLLYGLHNVIQALGGSLMDTYSPDAVTHVVCVDVATILQSSLFSLYGLSEEDDASTYESIYWPRRDVEAATTSALGEKTFVMQMSWLQACMEWGIFVKEEPAYFIEEFQDRHKLLTSKRATDTSPKAIRPIPPPSPLRVLDPGDDKRRAVLMPRVTRMLTRRVSRTITLQGSSAVDIHSGVDREGSSPMYATECGTNWQVLLPNGRTAATSPGPLPTNGTPSRTPPRFPRPNESMQPSPKADITTERGAKSVLRRGSLPASAVLSPRRSPSTQARSQNTLSRTGQVEADAFLVHLQDLFHFSTPGSTPLPDRRYDGTPIQQCTERDDRLARMHNASTVSPVTSPVNRVFHQFGNDETVTMEAGSRALASSTSCKLNFALDTNVEVPARIRRCALDAASDFVGDAHVPETAADDITFMQCSAERSHPYDRDPSNSIFTPPRQARQHDSEDSQFLVTGHGSSRPWPPSASMAGCASESNHCAPSVHSQTCLLAPWNPCSRSGSHELTQASASNHGVADCLPHAILGGSCGSTWTSQKRWHASGKGTGDHGVHTREAATCEVLSPLRGSLTQEEADFFSRLKIPRLDTSAAPPSLRPAIPIYIVDTEDDREPNPEEDAITHGRERHVSGCRSSSAPPQWIQLARPSIEAPCVARPIETVGRLPNGANISKSASIITPKRHGSALRVYVLHDVPEGSCLVQQCQDSLAEVALFTIRGEHRAMPHIITPSPDDPVQASRKRQRTIPVDDRSANYSRPPEDPLLLFVDERDGAEIIVSHDLTPRESVLTAIAGGLWVVRPSFLRQLPDYVRKQGRVPGVVAGSISNFLEAHEWCAEFLNSDALPIHRSLAKQCRLRRQARQLCGRRVFDGIGFVLCFPYVLMPQEPAKDSDAGDPLMDVPDTTDAPVSLRGDCVTNAVLGANDSSGLRCTLEDRCPEGSFVEVAVRNNHHIKKKVTAILQVIQAGGGRICDVVYTAQLPVQHNVPDQSLRCVSSLVLALPDVTQRIRLGLPESPPFFDDMAMLLCAAITTEGHGIGHLPDTSKTSSVPVRHLMCLFDSTLMESSILPRQSGIGLPSVHGVSLREWLYEAFSSSDGSDGSSSAVQQLQHHLRHARDAAHQSTLAAGQMESKAPCTSVTASRARSAPPAMSVLHLIGCSPQLQRVSPCPCSSPAKEDLWCSRFASLSKELHRIRRAPAVVSGCADGRNLVELPKGLHMISRVSMGAMSWVAQAIAGQPSMGECIASLEV